MADFFDKLKDTINKGVATASALTQELIDTTKLKSDICALEAQKKKLLTDLGELAHEMIQNGAIDEGKLQVKSSEIQELTVQIRSLEDSIVQHQNKSNESSDAGKSSVKCSCGADLAAGVKFCGSCGAKT